MFLKSFKKIALIAGLTVGAMSAAHAVPVQWTDYAGNGPRSISQGETYSYSHNIIDNGYNALTDTLVSASLSIGLFDDDIFGDFPWLGDKEETVGFKFDNGQWIKQAVDGWVLDWDQFDFTLTSLLQDGVLNVKIKAFSGDFVFGGSRLVVTADRASVPEPATLSMLGLGVLAVGFAARRRSAAK